MPKQKKQKAVPAQLRNLQPRIFIRATLLLWLAVASLVPNLWTPPAS
jgi:hypothetical protein